MYNLAKLLTDEPAKLERLILLFIKLVITFSFTVMLMGYDFSVQVFIDRPIPDKFSGVQLVYFFISLTAVWIALWVLIGEAILCEGLVRLICWKIPKKEVFDGVLEFVGAISKNTHYVMVIDILRKLEDEDDKIDLEDGQSRLNKYFSLSVIIFILFLSSNEINLSAWQIVLGIFILINLLVACLVVHIVKSYVFDNRELVIRQLEPMAYSQKTLDAIRGMNFFISNYGIPEGHKYISIKRKTDDVNYPELIIIDTAFHWNQALGQIALTHILNAWNDSYKTNTFLKNSVIMTNIKPNKKIRKLMEPLHGLIYIYAKTEKQVFHRLELAMFHLEVQQREKVLALK